VCGVLLGVLTRAGAGGVTTRVGAVDDTRGGIAVPTTRGVVRTRLRSVVSFLDFVLSNWVLCAKIGALITLVITSESKIWFDFFIDDKCWKMLKFDFF
jgi:hypothetical protein